MKEREEMKKKKEKLSQWKKDMMSQVSPKQFASILGDMVMSLERKRKAREIKDLK